MALLPLPRLNIKTWLIIAAILFLAAAVFTVNIQAKKIKKQRQEIERLSENNSQLLAEGQQIQNLVLREKEVTGRIKRERDSLAAVVKVKPKYVEKIITIETRVYDTIKVQVPAIPIAENVWRIQDSDRCFKWEGIVWTQGDSLDVKRTLFEYNNSSVQTFWKKAPRFLGIRVGRWKYYQKIDAVCGDVKYQAITFEK